MGYVYVLLGLIALITLHEAGHFGAAKAVGMRVERFSLFFGPMWLKRTVNGTDYGVGVIPLGGYVKISGMNPEEVYGGDLALEYPDARSGPRSYVNQPVWKRIAVIAAGPVVNLVIAFLVFGIVLLANGIYPTGGGYQVAGIEANSAAAGALEPGDRLVSIDGRAVSETSLADTIDASHCAGDVKVNGCVASPAVDLVVDRAGRRVDLVLHPRYSSSVGRNLVGFTYGAYHEALSLPAAFGKGADQMWTEISATVSALAHLYESKERRQIHSTVGVVVEAQQATSYGTASAFYIMGGISLALAIINLLPFLPLDGGHIFWALVEKARRGRKVSLATMERASFVGLALILGLFAIGLSNDISTFIHGGNFLGGG